MDGCPCLNCGETVPPDQGKIFAQVFVCPRCFEIAEKLYNRGKEEMSRLLLLLKEQIRRNLLEGKLKPGSSDLGEPVSKAEVLRAMRQLQEKPK